MTTGYKIGIDPGQSTLGLAVLDDQNKILLRDTLNPRSYGSICKAVDEIETTLIGYMMGGQTTASIEKYVIYGTGTPSSSSIDVIMMVGALQHMFHFNGIDATLFKAIDWKKTACKSLFKEHEFRNPSDSFDKKFSFAAAECICGEKPPTDHEADAIGLAYVSALEK